MISLGMSPALLGSAFFDNSVSTWGRRTRREKEFPNDASRSQPFQSNYNAENVATKPGNAANANGDLTRVTDFQAQRTNRFDAWNRLVGSTLTNITGGGRIIYRYDALGR